MVRILHEALSRKSINSQIQKISFELHLVFALAIIVSKKSGKSRKESHANSRDFVQLIWLSFDILMLLKLSFYIFDGLLSDISIGLFCYSPKQ